MTYSVLQYNLGNYEPFREPDCNIPSNCEYVYVTDNSSLKSSKMKIVHFNRSNDVIADCSYVRYHPFEFVSNDVVFYIDACKQMIRPIDPIIEKFSESGCDLALNIHEFRYNFLEELALWIRIRGVKKESIKRMIELMALLGYDFNYKGMIQTTSKIERKNLLTSKIDEIVYNTSFLLADEAGFPRVEQVLYSFVLNKYFSDKIKVLPYSSRLHNSKYFRNYTHGANNVFSPSTVGVPYLDSGYLFDELTKLEQLQNL